MMQESLALRLRVLRAERRATLREVEAETGVAKETLSELERGRRRPKDVTLAKLADFYGVPVAELLEEPVPLVEAPQGTGHPEQLEDEEERSFIRQSADSLKQHITKMKQLKELREAEMEDIESGVGPSDARVFQMQLADKGLRDLLNELGALGFAEAVTAGREMAEPWSIPLCHELLRHLRDLEALTAQATASRGAVEADFYVEEADIHVEKVKGMSKMETYLRNSGPDHPGAES
jgi:transcriptional regulator with XRE-family HTH domain